MTKREIALLAVRVLAVYTLVSTAEHIIWAISAWIDFSSASLWPYLPHSDAPLIQSFASSVLYFCISLVLLLFAPGVAALLSDEDPLVPSGYIPNFFEAQILVFRGIGFYLLVSQSSMLIATSGILLFGNRGATANAVFTQAWFQWLSSLLQVLFGLLLLFGGRGFIAGLARWRDWGRDPSYPQHHGQVEPPEGEEDKTNVQR